MIIEKNKINSSNKNDNSYLNKLISNLKTIVNQSKLKLKNLSTNINALNSNLNLISGNLEKKKYSLATSRIEKLFQLNNTMSTNIKSLEALQLNILNEIKTEQISSKKSFNSTFTKIRPNRTPSPFTPTRTNTKNKFATISDKNNILDKKIQTKRDLSVSMFNSKIRGKSTNIRDIKNLKTINIDGRSFSRNKVNNYEKENEELKKKLSIQKQINDRLTKELNKSRRKSNGNITSPKINSKIIHNKSEKNIKDAEVIEEMGVKDQIKLKSTINGAEPWTEAMRIQIEERLNIKAFDIYGLSELMGPGVANDCEFHKGMHIFEDYFLPEIIDPNSKDTLADDVTGELVLTNLNKEGMPLLRYRTRDLTSISHDVCDCGRTTARLSRFKGRSDDMLIIRGVNVFPSQIETALLSLDETTPNYQIIVDRVGSLDNLTVKVEVDEKFFSDEIRELEKLEKKIAYAIQQMIGLATKVKLVEPRSIERSEGKAKRVIDNRKFD